MHRVRPARHPGAPRIQELLEQLGYPVDLALMQDKLSALERNATDAVLVAEAEGQVVGVISLHVLDLFHAPGRLGRITSLVVDAARRGAGAGEALVAAADEFFRAAGCVRAEVTSGDHRGATHAFYEAQGYAADERRFVKRYGPVAGDGNGND